MKVSASASNMAKIVPTGSNEHLLPDDFLSDLDLAFNEIQMSPATKNAKKAKTSKSKWAKDALVDMQQTFIGITRNHLKPIVRYIKAVREGIDSKDICEVMVLIVDSVLPKTKQVKLTQHEVALKTFRDAVKSVLKQNTKKITQEQLQKLQTTFGPVVGNFELELRGHSTAVLNVLAFYKALNRNKKVSTSDIRKIFSIGVPSITMLRECALQELSNLTGLSIEKVQNMRSAARTFTLFELI